MLDVIDLLVHSPIFVRTAGKSLSSLRQTCTEMRNSIPVHLVDPTLACARIISSGKGLPELQFAHEVLGCPVDDTTIEAAVVRGDMRIIDYLLSGYTTELEESALVKATELENLEVLEYLVDKNYNQMDKYYRYKTVTSCLLSYGKVDLVEKIVAKGGEICPSTCFSDAIDKQEDTAALEYLLKKGYGTDLDRDLALEAVCLDSLVCLKWLNQRGYPNCDYMAYVAVEKELTDITEYLRECGLKIPPKERYL
eukprot:624193-Pyramimonas_sp.AAC.1